METLILFVPILILVIGAGLVITYLLRQPEEQDDIWEDGE